MAILQISKLQQRSGNLVDLPQLDDAEFGWASDQRRLFIGKTTPNENVEVLTAYSKIAFSQIDGAVGNINISNVSLSTGQVLAFNGTDWVNTGRGADGLLAFGDIGNVKIDGGAIGFVLQTDGSGNLSWTPKATIVSYIENITQADPAVVTTTTNHYLTKGAQVTITNAQGMIEVNGNSYYANVLTSNTFSLYSDSLLTTSVDSTGFGAYSYTSVSDTTTGTNEITVGDSTQFSANSAVQFVGDMTGTGISTNITYYVLGAPPDSTHIKIATSPDSNTSNVVQLQTASVSANVYQTGGQVVASSGATTFVGDAAGSNTAVQYANATGQLGASSNFTFDYANNIMTVNGNVATGNVNVTGIANASRFVSTITTGIAPLQVTSTTRVANLNVATAGIANTVNDSAQPNITSVGALTSLTVTGKVTAGQLQGDGGNISNVQGSNVSGTVTSATVATNASALLQNTSTATTVYPTFTTNSANGNSSAVINTSITANLGNASITATTFVGALSGIATSATTAGTVTTAAQPNITSVGTLVSLTVTGNISSNNLSTSNNVAATYFIPSVNNNVSAAGATQGTATLIASQINVISTVSSGQGVVMPTAISGMRLTLINTSANSCSVYPATGGTINSLGTNTAFALAAGARLDFQATSTTQWYTLNATYS